jgi:hypothetical protein
MVFLFVLAFYAAVEVKFIQYALVFVEFGFLGIIGAHHSQQFFICE